MHRMLWPALDRERFASLVRGEHLATARIEPTYSQRREALLDLAFEHNGEWIVVPMLRVEGLMLLTRENPPISWPLVFREMSAPRLREVEERLLPWLRSLATGRFFNQEEVRIFKNDARQTFDDVRRAGFYGAAPYREVFKTLAPGVYAQRFARNRSVAIAGPNAGNLLSVLSSVTRECAVDHTELSRRWFGAITSVALDRSCEYDCYVGPRELAQSAAFSVFEAEAQGDEHSVIVAEPIPADVTVSFDPEDAPVARTFGVPHRMLEVSPSSIRSSTPAGGSSGAIALVVRDDGEKFPDADTDAAHALAAALRAEGFDARISPAQQVDVAATDVIHVFGLRHGAGLVALLRDAEAARVPVVVTPYADDRNEEAVIGAHGALAIPRGAVDPDTLEEYYWAFARRRISNLTAGTLYDDATNVLMLRAAVALVTSPAEEAFLRERFGYRGQTIVTQPVVSAVTPSGNIGALVGPSEYILMHAPLEPTANQLFAIRASGRVGLPLVLLGPVQNIEYFRYVTEAAGPNAVLLRDAGLNEAELEGIYARARVVADIGSAARGLERLGRGMAHGAAVVAPKAGYAAEIWGELVETVDPMDLASIEAGFMKAWNRRPLDAERFRVAAASSASVQGGLLAAVTAYGQASGVLVP